MDTPALANKHSLANIDRENRTAVCSICGPVRIYVHKRRRYSNQRCINSGKLEAKTLKDTYIKENTELILNYIRTKACKRCGLWPMNPKDFRFFELHLPNKRKISALKNHMDPKRLKVELERRDLFCKTCYLLMRKEVTHNISAPPLKPFTSL